MKHRLDIALPGLIWPWIAAISTAAIAFLFACSASAQNQEASNGEIVILAFGDSLTAGYLLPPDKSFPAQLQGALRDKGHNVRVINSGVSGDTAADGLARLDWSLNEKVDGAIVEFGGNDALRGFDPKITQPSLDAILQGLKDRRIELLVAGMEAPRNWGPDYDDAFRKMYSVVAEKYGALLYPFFLKDVATVRSLNLSDGLHPTSEGVAVIVRNILPTVETLIERIKEKRTSGPS